MDEQGHWSERPGIITSTVNVTGTEFRCTVTGRQWTVREFLICREDDQLKVYDHPGPPASPESRALYESPRLLVVVPFRSFSDSTPITVLRDITDAEVFVATAAAYRAFSLCEKLRERGVTVETDRDTSRKLESWREWARATTDQNGSDTAQRLEISRIFTHNERKTREKVVAFFNNALEKVTAALGMPPDPRPAHTFLDEIVAEAKQQSERVGALRLGIDLAIAAHDDGQTYFSSDDGDEVPDEELVTLVSELLARRDKREADWHRWAADLCYRMAGPENESNDPEDLVDDELQGEVERLVTVLLGKPFASAAYRAIASDNDWFEWARELGHVSDDEAGDLANEGRLLRANIGGRLRGCEEWCTAQLHACGVSITENMDAIDGRAKLRCVMSDYRTMRDMIERVWSWFGADEIGPLPAMLGHLIETLQEWHQWATNQAESTDERLVATPYMRTERLWSILESRLRDHQLEIEKLTKQIEKQKAGLRAWRGFAVGVLGDPGAEHMKGPELREALGNTIAVAVRQAREAGLDTGEVQTAICTFEDDSVELPARVANALRVGSEVKTESGQLMRVLSERIERVNGRWQRTLWLVREPSTRGPM